MKSEQANGFTKQAEAPFLSTSLCKAEQFTFNLRQTDDSMRVVVPGKAQPVI
jgi:hypothetical protein